MQKAALLTSGIVFALLAISHAIRLVSPVEILINGYILPFSISTTAGLIFALLSAWMFVATKKIK